MEEKIKKWNGRIYQRKKRQKIAKRPKQTAEREDRAIPSDPMGEMVVGARGKPCSKAGKRKRHPAEIEI